MDAAELELRSRTIAVLSWAMARYYHYISGKLLTELLKHALNQDACELSTEELAELLSYMLRGAENDLDPSSARLLTIRQLVTEHREHQTKVELMRCMGVDDDVPV